MCYLLNPKSHNTAATAIVYSSRLEYRTDDWNLVGNFGHVLYHRSCSDASMAAAFSFFLFLWATMTEGGHTWTSEHLSQSGLLRYHYYISQREGGHFVPVLCIVQIRNKLCGFWISSNLNKHHNSNMDFLFIKTGLRGQHPVNDFNDFLKVKFETFEKFLDLIRVKKLWCIYVA